MEGVEIPGLKGKWRQVTVDDYIYVGSMGERVKITSNSEPLFFIPAETEEEKSWRDLPAGPELDQALCSAVLGKYVTSLRKFSEDLEDAFVVVEEMCRQGYEFSLAFGPVLIDQYRTVTFIKGVNSYTWRVPDDCLAEAICRAALLAKESEE